MTLGNRVLSFLSFLFLASISLTDACAIVGGTPDGIPPDSPASRVDANSTTSPFAGVGSLTVFRSGSNEIQGHFTASAIDPWHVITAAHVVSGKAPEEVRFNLNYGADLSHQIRAQSIVVHPDFAGFVASKTSGLVHDDIAIVRLAEILPFGVPFYRVRPTPVPIGAIVTFVGYGAGGDGVRGAYVSGTPSVKRLARNAMDRMFPDNGGKPHYEVFLYDFDGPDRRSNRMGGATLGNAVEGLVASGDSGSPVLVPGTAGAWQLVGISTFVSSKSSAPERFGSIGGGVLLYSYAAWIESVLAADGKLARPASQ